MTVALVVLLALGLAALVVVPLAVPGQADPLPDDSDPLLQDLEEERDALLGAIRELDAREDLGGERRDELRARYEAKAARVLRALDERRATVDGQAERPTRRAPRRAPWGVVGLLLVSAGIAATLGGFVLPRVGQNATVTTFDEADIAAGERIRDLRRAAERDPSAAAWTELGDAYWAAEDAGGAREAYGAAIEDESAPARAFQRLGLLALQDDIGRAQELLEQARERDPSEPNTLGTLGEIYLQSGRYGDALDAFEALAAVPGAADDPMVQERLALLREIVPLADAAEADPSAETVLALSEALWDADARDAAARGYFRIVTELDAQEPTALARVGELLFLDGRTEDAVALLDRARASAASRGATLPDNALLFLGNAAFAQEDWTLAIDAWQQHLERSDDPGRVPQLIEQAQARRDGTATGEVDLPMPGAPSASASPADTPGAAPPADGSDGAALFQANCAVCHGPQGGGGSGPRLVGNANAGRPDNVESLIRFGRGMMPGFTGRLDDEQIETLRGWVVDTFAP